MLQSLDVHCDNAPPQKDGKKFVNSIVNINTETCSTKLFASEIILAVKS
jgi:hypothetical protein